MAKEMVQVLGLRELEAKLARMDERTQAATLRRAARAGGLPIQNAAKRLVHYRTGTTRRNIRTEVLKSTNTRCEVSVGVGPEIPWGARLEFGFQDTDSLGRTYDQAPAPFLRPAFDQEKENAVAEIQSVLTEQIMEAVS